jgi:para-nitrobenzyl esterase
LDVGITFRGDNAPVRLTRSLIVVLVAVLSASILVANAAQAATAQRCATTVKPSKLVVDTDRGAVRGTATGGVSAWKGVPFAAPPVGPLRWHGPEQHACWKNVVDASAFGAPCPQLDGDTAIGNEDCLTLNVWRPDRGTKPRAVMVFVHGGGHVQGSTSQVTSGVTLYDGAHLAATGDVVVVTVQYRLGALGWLADDALGTAKQPAGNYGLLDQIAALRWVQSNIAEFGGDPKRVLVFGESAGAVDTCLLVASPLATGLFSRAMMESGACVASDATTAEQAAAKFQSAAGCTNVPDVAACLRAVPVDTVLHTVPSTVNLATIGRPLYGPFVDGRVLPAAPLDLISEGKGNHVPVVVGSNQDESALFLRGTTTADAYTTQITDMVGPALAQRILAEYPVDQYGTPRAALIAATTDPRFTCTARKTVRALLQGQSEPAYRYSFTQVFAGGPLAALGAFHGAELFFVFGNLATVAHQPTPDETALSDAMIGYWSRFAATGNPNGGGAPEWPRAKAGSDPYLKLDTTIAASDGVRSAQCDFWDGLTG